MNRSIYSPEYDILDLNTNALGYFNGGKCIRKLGSECEFYIAKDGVMSATPETAFIHTGKYSYNPDTSAVEYSICNPKYSECTTKSQMLFKLKFIPQSFRK